MLAFLPGAQACNLPIIDVDLDPPCEGFVDCDPAPRPGETLTFEGFLHYRVYVDDPCDRFPRDDVAIDVSGLDPSWLSVKAEPASIRMPFEEIYDAERAALEGSEVVFSHSWPLKVEVTGLGAPNATEIASAAELDNNTRLYVKAYGTSEGIPDTFGISELRFDMQDALPKDLSDDRQRPEVRSAPPPTLAWLIIGPALVVAVLAGRRFTR